MSQISFSNDRMLHLTLEEIYYDGISINNDIKMILGHMNANVSQEKEYLETTNESNYSGK